jgi:pimeloyl-ACP methyl ester carboxylesterase
MTAARPRAAGSVVERSGYIESGTGSVYCTLFSPEEATAPWKTCAVLLGAFAEERKSSTRPLVEIARALAAKGVPSARVDFRGCGDASGRSVDITLEGMIEDAVAAAAGAATELACERVAMCELRLGASVAFLASPRVKAHLGACVLMEPVIKGADYVRELTRKQAIRKMMTKGDASCEDAGDACVFDLDGIELSRSFVDDVGRIDLVAAAKSESASSAPVAILQIGPRSAATRSVTALGEALCARVDVIRMEPFWLQTERVGVDPVVTVLSDVLVSSGATEEREE